MTSPRDRRVTGPAIHAYRTRIDRRCPSDERAVAAILAALETAHEVSRDPEGGARWRANNRHGRIYLVIGARGDVIDVQPSSAAVARSRRPAPGGHGVERVPSEERTEVCQLRLAPATVAALDRRAEERGVTRSAMAEQILSAALHTRRR